MMVYRSSANIFEAVVFVNACAAAGAQHLFVGKRLQIHAIF
jgi:acyl-coenzyme A synthetase/AMP-(fatty) acid ligase